MLQTTRFEEDLYFLNEQLNALESGLSLKIDHLYFFDKIIEDLFFIDSTLNKLYETLSENAKLVQVGNIMRSIQTTKIRFLALLDFINDGRSGLADSFFPFRAKLLELISIHKADIARINEIFITENKQATPREGISQEEYQFLFPEDDAEA